MGGRNRTKCLIAKIPNYTNLSIFKSALLQGKDRDNQPVNMYIKALYAKKNCKVKGPEEMEEDRIPGNT